MPIFIGPIVPVVCFVTVLPLLWWAKATSLGRITLSAVQGEQASAQRHQTSRRGPT
ncbi:MAG: hypothetical protein ACO4AI_13660 [Prochlorothrix sp.]